MQSRKPFLIPLSGLILIGLLVALLTWLFTIAPQLFPNIKPSLERHLLLESFVTFIDLGLFLVFLFYFRRHPLNSALLLALGFFSFFVIQSFQILSTQGFAVSFLFSASLNSHLGLDLLARGLFSLHFLFATIFLTGLIKESAFKNKIAFYGGSLFLLVCGSGYLLSAWRPHFVVGGELTLLAKGLEMSVAVMFGTASILLIRQFIKTRGAVYFWFLIGSILGIFVSVFFVSWSPQTQILADIAHGLKVLTFATFCIGFLLMQSQSPGFRAGFERAFKTDGSGSEFPFYELVEQLPDGVAIFDKTKKLVFCNEAFAKLLDYSKEDILGRDYAAFLGKQASNANDRFEAVMIARDGGKIPVRVHERTVVKGSGEILGRQYFVSDLRQQAEAEEKLEKLVRQKIKDAKVFEQCIEHSTEGLLVTDLKSRIRYVNKAFTRMTGYEKDELVGRETSTLICDKRGELLHEVIWTSAREGRVWRGEFHTKKKDGGSLLGELSVVPIHEDGTGIARYLWIEKDVTRRKTLEKSLHQYTGELTEKTRELESSKAYYKTLISGMTDILIVVDNDNQCTFINESGKKRLKYQAQDLTKQRLPIFFDDLKRLEKDYGSTIKIEIKDFETVIKSRSGDAILCSWHARPLFDSSGRRIGAMAVGRDITEYKKLQNELQEHAKNLEQKVDARTAELQTKVNQLAMLLEIGEEIRLNTDIDVILNKICDAVLALGWKKVAVSMREFDKRMSRPIAVAGLQPKQIEEVMSWREIPFEHTERYFKEAFRISNSYLIPEDAQMTAKNTPFSIYTDLGAAADAEDEWRSLDALLVPIRSKDSILGVISVDDPEDRKHPGFDQIRDLEIFADKAALAIENARFVKAKKETERQTKFLAEVSKIFHSSLKMEEVLDAIVRKGGKAIGEFCSLLLVEDETGNLLHEASYHSNPQVVDRFLKGLEDFPRRTDNGIIGSVVKTGKPYFAVKSSSEKSGNFKNTPFAYIERYNAISSLMVTPLKVRSRIIGVLVYLLSKSEHHFKHEDLQLAEQLAERAAIAIENARLFKEAGEKAKELEKASRLKSEFLASVSHELRTPLNAIITLSDILIRGMSGDLNADQSKQLEIIQRSGKNLLNLINDILDLAKVESQKVEPIYSEIPVRGVVEETIEHIRPLCIQKRLTLEHEFSDSMPEVIYSDQDKLTKALSNLLSNAVKFTRKGKISVKVYSTRESELKIEVADSGIGIPNDRIEEVFKEFHQIDSSDSRAFGGTGLGLAITRKVLDVIGGSISVKSQLGKGSTFTMVIPIRSKADVKKEERIDLDQKMAEQKIPPSNLDLSDDREQLDEAKKLVLVIDDDKEANYVMIQYLHEANYQVVCPETGEDVIDLAKQYYPFAITLDIIMPDEDGWEILRILKSEPEVKHIPVIIASILAEKERAFEIGADEYLVKPFESHKLLGVLAALNASTKKSVISDISRFLASKRQSLLRRRKGAVSDFGKRILLVDDDNDTRYVLKYILEEAGYSLYFASEGWEGVKQAESIRPNLILMDIMMPGMNGYEATKNLKSRDEFKQVPIVAMTAKAMKGDREKTMLAGCDDYIAKPFVTEDILTMVEKWLQASKSN